jgi:hypothetical protein
MATGAKGSTKEVATTDISRDQLAEMENFADAIKALQALGGEVINSDILGDGFSLLKEKEKLVGVPLMFVTWNFSQGDFGEMVSARVIAEFPNNNYVKYVINDGSTGMYQQLRDATDRHPDVRMLFAKRGLRKSDFTYVDEKGTKKPATTFYIDTSS